MKRAIFILLAIPLVIFFMLSGIKYLYPVDDDDAISALMASVPDHDLETMICVAQSIRNRRNLEGIYNFHPRRDSEEETISWETAEDAWLDSNEMKDKTNGSKNFGTAEELRILDVNSFKAKCGKFYFY